MRVALIAPFGLGPKGTTSARVLPVARVLARQGAHVQVIVPPWDDPARAGQRGRQDGYELVHTHVGPGPLAPGVILAELLWLVREWKADVVHAFKPIGYSGAMAWLLARRSRARGRPFRPLVGVDADDLEGPAGWAGRRQQGALGALRGIQERRTLARAHLVTVASRWLASYARKLGVADETILYIPNGHAVRAVVGADVTQRHDMCAPARLLWYTRFTEARPARVADLVAPLLREDPRRRLLVVGEEIGSGDRAEAEAAVARVGVAGQVDFLGYRPEGLDAADVAGVVAIYPLDDDLVNRARCPSKIPQLMALGVPIVAERVGEASTYLSDCAGECLARPGDTADFQRLARRLLADRAVRSSVAGRLREASEQWRWEKTSAALLSRYEAALAADASGARLEAD